MLSSGTSRRVALVVLTGATRRHIPEDGILQITYISNSHRNTTVLLAAL
jgi:hypothetical protein